MNQQASTDQDIVLRETRWAALFVIPILAAAFLILYIIPDSNGQHFAWPVKPRMSAMMLGATYFTGVIFFSVVLRAKGWHEVRLGLLPVVLFASLLGIATILHWDRFSHAQPHFWLWVALYWILPFVLLWLWIRNERKARPLPSQPDEVQLKPSLRLIIALLAVTLAVMSLLLFILPTSLAPYWPWTITALTARVISAELGLFGFFMLEVALVARWSEIRSLLLPQLISPPLFLFSIIASWDNFDKANPVTWGFVAFVVIVFVIGFPAIYFPLEARRRKKIASLEGSDSKIPARNTA